MAGTLFLLKFESPRSAAELAKLGEMAAATKPPLTFRQVNTSSGHKIGHALFIMHYYSDADYDQVKAFYRKTLAPDWVATEEEIPRLFPFDAEVHVLAFRKGEYEILVECVHQNPWEYAVSYVWEQK